MEICSGGPRRPLSMLLGAMMTCFVVASSSDEPQHAAFRNKGDATLYIFWQHPSGKEEVPMGSISPGESSGLNSFPGHIFHFRAVKGSPPTDMITIEAGRSKYTVGEGVLATDEAGCSLVTLRLIALTPRTWKNQKKTDQAFVLHFQ